MPNSAEIQRLTRFFQEEGKALKRYARFLVGTQEVAEDIVQDLMVRMLQRESLSSIRELKCYAYLSVKNLVIDYRRRESCGQKAIQQCMADHPDESTVQSGPEQFYEFKCLIEQVDSATRQLSSREREAFLLKANGMTQREISEKLKCSVGTVNAMLQKAFRMTGHLR